MLNGDYYTIAEAAEFIASKTGKKKNNQDVLLDAKNGKIRLCTWFDGTLYKFNRDIKGTGKLQSIEDYKFAGYIQIPKKRITPKGGMIQFGSVTIIEVKDEWIWAKNSDPRTLDDNELSDRYFDSHSNSYQPCNLFVNLDEALIPEQDLLEFAQQETLSDKNMRAKRVGLQIQQEDKILRLIRETTGCEPFNLPTRKEGKAGTKADVREKLNIPSELFRSTIVFNKAWERLSEKGLLKYRK